MFKKIIFSIFVLMFSGGVFASKGDQFEPGRMIAIPYQLPVVKNGRTKFIFPISIQKAPDYRSYFFAQKFQFGSGNVGYIGARPWPGENQMSMAFSVFGHRTKVINESLCRYGANGGPGISCSKIVSYEPGKKYYMTVQKSPGYKARWRGYVSDQITGKKTLVGEWEVPEKWGNLIGRQVGFIEYYSSVPSCVKLPSTDVTFYPPIDGVLEKPNMEFCDLCAKKGGVPLIVEELNPSAFHFTIN